MHSVAFSADGTKIVSGSSDSGIFVWDVATGERLQTLDGHSRVVSSVTFFANDLKIVSGSRDGTVKIWNATSGKCLKTLKGHTAQVTSVAVSSNSANGKIVSGSMDSTVKIWDATTGRCLQTLQSNWVHSVAFSSDGTKIVIGSDDYTKFTIIKYASADKCRH